MHLLSILGILTTLHFAFGQYEPLSQQQQRQAQRVPNYYPEDPNNSRNPHTQMNPHEKNIYENPNSNNNNNNNPLLNTLNTLNPLNPNGLVQKTLYPNNNNNNQNTYNPNSWNQTQIKNKNPYLSNTLATQNIGGGGGNFGNKYEYGGDYGQSGVSVQVQLRSYSNSDFRIDNERLCTCPKGDNRCLEASPSRRGYSCLVSFMIIISSADSSVQYRATPYVPLNDYGQVSQEYASSFQQSFDFQLENQPTAIDVFVHNLGPVINGQSGAIEQSNTVSHVDTFVKSLNGSGSGGNSGGYGGGGNGQQQATLSGTLLGTQLSLMYTITCRGRLLGPGCDLNCNASSVNSGSAICVNVKTGYYSLCPRRNAAFNRAPGFNAQRSGDSNPVTTTTAYRSSYRTHVGEAENQALTSSGPPLAAPRNGSTGHNNLSHYLPPPLGVKPKSSMRSPPHYPLPAPAHLGGSNSLNDTLNTSFAGSQVPVAGSVSADV